MLLLYSYISIALFKKRKLYNLDQPKLLLLFYGLAGK